MIDSLRALFRKPAARLERKHVDQILAGTFLTSVTGKPFSAPVSPPGLWRHAVPLVCRSAYRRTGCARRCAGGLPRRDAASIKSPRFRAIHVAGGRALYPRRRSKAAGSGCDGDHFGNKT
jgi:hypothetical protein